MMRASGLAQVLLLLYSCHCCQWLASLLYSYICQVQPQSPVPDPLLPVRPLCDG
jgi:hypothetical protein